MKYEFYQPRPYQVTTRFYASFISVFADKSSLLHGLLIYSAGYLNIALKV